MSRPLDPIAALEAIRALADAALNMAATLDIPPATPAPIGAPTPEQFAEWLKQGPDAKVWAAVAPPPPPPLQVEPDPEAEPQAEPQAEPKAAPDPHFDNPEPTPTDDPEPLLSDVEKQMLINTISELPSAQGAQIVRGFRKAFAIPPKVPVAPRIQTHAHRDWLEEAITALSDRD